MITPDLINCLFEVGGTVFTWVNIHKLRKDKQVKGVYWPIWIFFASWGMWNLYYYPAIGQWWSFLGGIGLVAGNIVWVGFAFKYRERK